VKLLGTHFTLLRPQFRAVPKREVRARVERILVTLGGADVLDQTTEIVTGLVRAIPDARIHVVIGPFFRRRDAGVTADNIVLHHAPSDLAPLMRDADLAITAGGQTTYELAAYGVPSVALCTAANQRGNLGALVRGGSLVHADSTGAAVELARVLAGDLARRVQLAAAGQRLVDGLGAERVAAALVDTGVRRRLA
jgi:spore coat polysaccharide biosynthesis predicted glycosyltransferase SpsG